MVRELKKFWKQVKSKQHILGILVIIAIAFCVATPMLSFMPKAVQAYEAQAYGDYAYHKSITIDYTKIDSALTNFPVWVYNISSDFAASILTNGSDIAFYDSTKTIRYNHEIEVWNKTSGELGVHVNVTSISSSVDTSFYIYYGDSDTGDQPNYNPTDVWDEYYTGVWHMNDSSGDIIGATASRNNGTEIGDPTYQQPGQLGYSIYFDGVGDFFTFPELNTTTGTAFTCSFWVYSNSTGAPRRWVSTSDGSFAYDTFGVRENADGEVQAWMPKEGNNTITVGLTLGGWEYFSWSGDTSSGNLYNNVTEVGTVSSPCGGLVAGNLYIGGLSAAAEYAKGHIDEVRISKIKRSSAWSNATYYTTSDPTSFLTFGSQESTIPSVYVLVGLPNNRFTWAGTVGTSVYCNATGDHNEVAEINMSINATQNVTEVRIFMDDFNDTGVYVNASNITLYISSDNSSWGSMGTYIDGGCNISINATTWLAGAGTNPFATGAGLTDTNQSIFCIFKVAIPLDADIDVYWSSSSAIWKIYIIHYS